jgi:hypothetical protein
MRVKKEKKVKKKKSVVKVAYQWRNILPKFIAIFPLHKKHMQRIFLFVVMMAVALSCGVSEIGGNGDEVSPGGGIWGGLKDSHDTPPSVREVCYMTAVDYQKGYDWRTDESKESVKCSLVVYEDGTPVMKVPVGDAYEVSPDPDRHRMIEGYL